MVSITSTKSGATDRAKHRTINKMTVADASPENSGCIRQESHHVGGENTLIFAIT
jgi:hypothetical protein